MAGYSVTPSDGIKLFSDYYTEWFIQGTYYFTKERTLLSWRGGRPFPNSWADSQQMSEFKQFKCMYCNRIVILICFFHSITTLHCELPLCLATRWKTKIFAALPPYWIPRLELGTSSFETRWLLRFDSGLINIQYILAFLANFFRLRTILAFHCFDLNLKWPSVFCYSDNCDTMWSLCDSSGGGVIQ